MLNSDFQGNVSLTDIDVFTKSNILRRANKISCSRTDFSAFRVLIFADFAGFLSNPRKFSFMKFVSLFYLQKKKIGAKFSSRFFSWQFRFWEEQEWPVLSSVQLYVLRYLLIQTFFTIEIYKTMHARSQWQLKRTVMQIEKTLINDKWLLTCFKSILKILHSNYL